MRSLLTANGFEVAATARNGAEALMQFEMQRPELVLMDLQMPEMDGIETTRQIKKEYPEAKIVMLTAVEDEDSLLAALKAGAEGYLLKEMEPESFLRQLAGLAAGETPLAPGLAGRLLREFQQQRQREEAGGERELTERQTELLRLITRGLTYKEVADRLAIKEVTVKYHVKEILGKLRLANKAQLIAHAYKLGL
ncbi:response regulator transcription factor [Selenomonadales bacterium 4137-cl]|uniref:Response regulator transcription factor n=2 Tax=Anaeroselena agilis TaxID=3063788 RepID=A0ABU3P4U9_9FIRM|nr:response regulator transcription factor [Selenomonadales bacterium 4137-cl]